MQELEPVSSETHGLWIDTTTHFVRYEVPKPSQNLKKATEVLELQRLSIFKHAVL